MVTEATVRESLRDEVVASVPGLSETIYEFWVPRTNERADLAAIGPAMWGYEIKTAQDTLRRLPRQVEAYNRLFDHCTVVLAERHLKAALTIVPEWWGVAVILTDHVPLS
ncbi:MAG: sce7726 family protein, partial [Trebonia sp.]